MTLEAFVEQLTGVGGVVHSVAGASAAATTIDGLLAEREARRVAFSDAADVARMRALLTAPCEAAQRGLDDLLSCDVGITAAQWGIAETGSLVLDSSAENHRLISLLPPVHIALLRADRILSSLDDALDAVRDPDTGLPPPAITLVTGPSRTADIELTLVVGVHGPRELHVVVLDQAGTG